MPKYTYMVMTKPLEGREAEWNDWHMNQHVKDVLKVPGFVNCRRFQVASHQPNATPPSWEFLVIYELDTDDVAGALSAMRRRFGTPLMPATSSSNPKNTVSVLWSSISEHAAQPA